MLIAISLILIAVGFRVAVAFTGGLHEIGAWNFAPVSAIAFCGALFLPRRFTWALPLGILLISDLILNAHYGVALFDFQILIRYIALATTVALGLRIRRSPHFFRVLLGSLAASVIFYVTTNTASWADSPAYAKTIGGWIQALTTGVPGFPPTVLFFRNTVLSDLLFTLLFLGCMSVAGHSSGEAEEQEPEPAKP
jgi:hypothetical protein